MTVVSEPLSSKVKKVICDMVESLRRRLCSVDYLLSKFCDAVMLEVIAEGGTVKGVPCACWK